MQAQLVLALGRGLMETHQEASPGGETHFSLEEGSLRGSCMDLPLGFFFPKSVLVTLANRLFAGLGGLSSGAITQLLGGSFSGV